MRTDVRRFFWYPIGAALCLLLLAASGLVLAQSGTVKGFWPCVGFTAVYTAGAAFLAFLTWEFWKIWRMLRRAAEELFEEGDIEWE